MTPDLVERVARAICLAELTKDGVWFDHEKMQRAVAQHEWKWRKHAEAAIDASQSAAPQQEGVGEALGGEIRLLRSMLDADIARHGAGESFMIRAGLLRDILAALASQSDASPPLVGVLRDALVEVMEWVDGWSPFDIDPEWPATKAKVREALSRVSGDAR